MRKRKWYERMSAAVLIAVLLVNHGDMGIMAKAETIPALEENLDSAEAVEKYLSDYDRQMIVTSTDIDILVKDFSDIIADGINKTLHPGIYS